MSRFQLEPGGESSTRPGAFETFPCTALALLGLIINSSATLRFMPALNISNGQVDEMLAILVPVLKRVLA